MKIEKVGTVLQVVISLGSDDVLAIKVGPNKNPRMRLHFEDHVEAQANQALALITERVSKNYGEQAVLSLDPKIELFHEDPTSPVLSPGLYLSVSVDTASYLAKQGQVLFNLVSKGR